MKLLRSIFRLPPTVHNTAVPEAPTANFSAEAQVLAPRPLYSAQEHAFPFAVWAISDRGVVRPDNQDAIFYLQTVMNVEEKSAPFGLFILADGLGGHQDGQLASRLAARTAAAHLIKTIYLPMLAGYAQDAGSEPLNESLAKAVELANRAVRENTDGGGSTLTALLLLDCTAYVVHVGDCRAYLIHDGAASQITEDHSLGQRLMELQALPQGDLAYLPERHTLYKALGQPNAPEPDISYHHLEPGTHILLCSDGLWGFVTQQELSAAFQRDRAPREACLQLVDLAISRGSDDNISLIALMSKD